MQAKPIKRIAALSLVLLLWWVDSSDAAAILDGRPVKGTPYDRKNALTEVLSRSYRFPGHFSIEPADQLFLKARRFAYRKEKNGDHWQFPQETEKMQAGDCEDKALWLYARLRAAGYQNLRLIVGKYRRGDAGYHVWLIREDEKGNVFILDPTIQNKIWPLTAFQPGFYRPLFSFDDTHRYSYSLNPPLSL